MKEYKDQEGARPNVYHRLVGALVLIALAVIFVPMVLDFRKDYGRVITGTNIPEKPDEYQVREVPLNPPAPAEAPVNDAGGTTAGPHAPPRQSGKESQAPQMPSGEVPDPADAGSAGGVPVERWMVQAASFSRRENAVALRARLEKAGYSAFVDRVVVKDKAVWRVGVGPVSEGQGRRLRDELERKLDLDGLVRRYDRDDAGR